MKVRLLTMLALSSFFLHLTGGQIPAPTAFSDFGYSSCSRDSCLFVPDDQNPHIYSHGDYKYTVNERGAFVLLKGGHTMLSTPLKDLSASVYVVWSGGGDWFALTWSDGGAIGGFHTRLFHVRGETVTEADSVEGAFASFKRRHYCKTRGDNVQAYGWDRATGGVMLVMSVYPTSDCGRDLGHTEGYLVRPRDGSVLRHLTSVQLNAYCKMNPVP